jgi:hypothetical protein
MKNLKKFIFAVALTGLTVAALPHNASAQEGLLAYSKTGTGTQGMMLAVYNVVDSLIADGTICSVDTVAAASGGTLRFVVRPYAGTALTRSKCIGIAAGTIRKSSQGGSGRVLVWGYHANAKMAATGISANTMVKISPAVHGAFAASADTLSAQVGWFIGYTSSSTAANSRGKVLLLNWLGRSVSAIL